jgi:hypothetical protein
VASRELSVGMKKVVGVAALITAFGFLGVGVWQGVASVCFLNRSVSTTGQVVDLKCESDFDTDSYHTVFEYKDGAGDVHRVTESWGTDPPSHQVGQTVDVLYDSQHPANARLSSFNSLWMFSLLCVVGALIGAGVGVWCLLAARLRHRSPAVGLPGIADGSP